MLDTLRHASYTQTEGYPCPIWQIGSLRLRRTVILFWSHSGSTEQGSIPRCLGPLTLLSHPFSPAELSKEVGSEAAPANGTEGKVGRQWVCPGAAGEGAADAAIVRSSRLGQCLAPRRQPQMFSSE